MNNYWIHKNQSFTCQFEPHFVGCILNSSSENINFSGLSKCISYLCTFDLKKNTITYLRIILIYLYFLHTNSKNDAIFKNKTEIDDWSNWRHETRQYLYTFKKRNMVIEHIRRQTSVPIQFCSFLFLIFPQGTTFYSIEQCWQTETVVAGCRKKSEKSLHILKFYRSPGTCMTVLEKSTNILAWD